MHGLPETEGGSAIKDNEAFERLCLEKLEVEGIRYQTMVRLGVKNENEKHTQAGRPWIRPLRVELSDMISKTKILKALYKLKRKESTMYITTDKTPKQRAEEKELKEKCKKYNEEHPTETVVAFIQKGKMAFRNRVSVPGN